MAWLDLVRVTQKPERPEAALSGLFRQGSKKKRKEMEKKRKKNLRDPGPPVECTAQSVQC